jgi:hypothetical protein
MVDEQFVTISDTQLDEFLKRLEGEGVKILDKLNARNTIKDFISAGFSLKLIEGKLREYNFDFGATKKYFDDIINSKKKADQAIEGVTELKKEKADETKMKKLSSRVGLIITSFVLGGVGFFTWRMMRKTTEDIGGVDLLSGPAGGLLSSFDKGAFIVGIAGIGVGILLSVFVAADYFVKKAKDKKAQHETDIKKAEINKLNAETGKSELNQELGTAEQVAQQKLEAPNMAAQAQPGQKPPKIS